MIYDNMNNDAIFMNFSCSALSFLPYKYVYRCEVKLDVIFSDISLHRKALSSLKESSVLDRKSLLQTKHQSCVNAKLNAICILMSTERRRKRERERERVHTEFSPIFLVSADLVRRG